MDSDKYGELSRTVPEKVLNEFGVIIHDRGDRVVLETSPANHEEHVSGWLGF